MKSQELGGFWTTSNLLVWSGCLVSRPDHGK